MKNISYLIVALLCPLFMYSQNLEVEGEMAADSMDLSSGLIKNLSDPVNDQDAATKAYVDLLETTLDSLETAIEVLDAKVDLLINYLVNEITSNVQQRLDLGETPKHIFDTGIVIDSLYGKSYAGGLIAYLNTTTGSGLVAAPVDQSNAEWGCNSDVEEVGTSSALGTGQANTSAIVNDCGEPGIAARLCNDLDDWGYDDWFLPSKDELDELYENLKVNGFGGFSSGRYWSSTEIDAYNAWLQDFLNGDQDTDGKDFTEASNTVRAVRAF